MKLVLNLGGTVENVWFICSRLQLAYLYILSIDVVEVR